jgi:hypothetical protein
MSYTDLRNFSCEYSAIVGDVTVQVEKLGGGTVGKAYTGVWRYIVTRSGGSEEIRRGQDVESGSPWTHAEAARFIGCQFTGEDPGTEEHSDYPHDPGSLHGCVACEARCHCGEAHDETCASGPDAHPMGDGKLHHVTECVWGGHESGA